LQKLRAANLSARIPKAAKEIAVQAKEEEVAMALYKRGDVYWCNFVYNGVHYQESTGKRTRKKAAEYEEDRRVEIRKEFDARAGKAKELGCSQEEIRRCTECGKLFNYGMGADKGDKIFCDEDCAEKWQKRQSPLPTVAQFLKLQFIPFAETVHARKPATLRYYKTGSASLTASHLADVRLDKINNEHAAQYAARLKKLSPSTVNCGLRTLRRAIYLASEWGVITSRPKIALAKGERKRERILADAEIKIYLDACEPVWREVSTILLGTGARPGEIFALRWERIQLNGKGGLLQIADGKSAAAKRLLPLVPAVFHTLKARWTASGEPENGWVFPADTVSRHIEGGSAKNYHARALAAIEKAAKDEGVEPPVKPFPPYIFRHTALTRLAESGCDAFTLARIAGHSSISITQRYCHPQAEAIERAFSKFGGESLHLSLQSESTNSEPALATTR
jgi:integrase